MIVRNCDRCDWCLPEGVITCTHDHVTVYFVGDNTIMDNDIPNIFLALNSADALEAPEPRWRKVNQAYPDTSRSDRHKSSTKQLQFRQGASAHSKQRLRITGRARVRLHILHSVYASQGGRLNRARTAGASASRTAHEMARCPAPTKPSLLNQRNMYADHMKESDRNHRNGNNKRHPAGANGPSRLPACGIIEKKREKTKKPACVRVS